MDSKKKQQDLLFLNTLGESLSENDDLSLKELKKELKEDGFDVDETLDQLMKFKQNASDKSKRMVLDLAKKNRLLEEENRNSIFGMFDDWDKEAILERLKELCCGGLSIPQASFRNLEGLSLDELKGLLEDVELLKKQNSNNDNEA